MSRKIQFAFVVFMVCARAVSSDPVPGVNFNFEVLTWMEKVACLTNCDYCASHTTRYYSACWTDVNRRNERCGDDPNRFFFSRGNDRCFCCP
ncbi:Glucosylglycerol-phosphate synthase [Frankliniella fusca]|uniref:Glucosylglycerol-phosphate synthase n=1 Tax=Frankliniella fusca TaxID=407009 RepID=A0AAE1HRY4_9NEOP|nr:Glucosylglycerol-phosphate synthase [Frankliniella fusca]KAK3926322.1 Glucosylglycerol-phosphate synthase [Frankliniella fusca]